MWKADKWQEYELIDSAYGEKLERWGKYILRRPDPQAVWNMRTSPLWEKADAVYHRSNTGGGHWEFHNKKMKDRWEIAFGDLNFCIKPMGFKHTGLFPEQAVNWTWFSELIRNAGRPIRVLNLFAYTGGATVAALKAGASVTHVDASKGMVSWAKENVAATHLSDAPVRYIVDDVLKFVAREKRRGKRYEAIIMDPPSYGRGPGGEVFKIENELYSLVEACSEILSDQPLFFLINSYTTGLSQTVLTNVLSLILKDRFGGKITADEIGLPMTAKSGLVLPCGISGRWQEK